jgi:hypothetical protein
MIALRATAAGCDRCAVVIDTGSEVKKIACMRTMDQCQSRWVVAALRDDLAMTIPSGDGSTR